MALTLEEDARRIFANTDMTGDCWLWQGKVSYDGYARASVGSKRNPDNPYRTGHAVHRWVYEYIVEPIPEGLAIDHRCNVRNCLNPAHMEAVAPELNTSRMRKRRVMQDYCMKGLHLMAVHAKVASNGHRYCGPCVKESKRLAHMARKERTQLNTEMAS